jgi:hypothetical protein
MTKRELKAIEKRLKEINKVMKANRDELYDLRMQLEDAECLHDDVVGNLENAIQDIGYAHDRINEVV